MFAIFALIILILYALLINRFIKGWDDTPEFEAVKSDVQPFVTIITACRNELEHLPYLFQAVNEQAYRNFELIVVDDGSTDESWEYSVQVQLGFPELKLIKNTGEGKKEAIKTGVLQSENELIITLDADSMPPIGWLNEIVLFYIQHPSDLIICPVLMNSDGSFLQEFQHYEFASLVASGAGAAGINMPILCNGANLAFRRETWLKSMDELHFEVSSGDDVFLLQSVKRRNGIIRFLKSKTAATTTEPCKTLKSFLNQRQRWASKKSAYSDWHLTATAILVFLASLLIVLNAVLAIWKTRFLLLFIILFLLKFAVDTYFFYKVRDFFGLKKVVVNSLLFSLVYPFYIVISAVGSLFYGKKRW